MAFAEPVAPRVYMDAVLTPNRSLSRRGLWMLLAALLAYNLLVAVFLVAIGAFPVPVFLGLDFVAVLIAFRINRRHGRWAERVQVTADRIEVSHRQPPAGERTVWTSPTAFTGVAVDQAGEHEARVRLTLSGRACSVGDRLSPKERVDFAAALKAAIAAARSERHRA